MCRRIPRFDTQQRISLSVALPLSRRLEAGLTCRFNAGRLVMGDISSALYPSLRLQGVWQGIANELWGSYLRISNWLSRNFGADRKPERVFPTRFPSLSMLPGRCGMRMRRLPPISQRPIARNRRLSSSIPARPYCRRRDKMGQNGRREAPRNRRMKNPHLCTSRLLLLAEFGDGVLQRWGFFIPAILRNMFPAVLSILVALPQFRCSFEA